MPLELTAATLACMQFIPAVLKADPAVSAACSSRIFRDYAPEVDPATGQATRYPFVVFSYLSAQRGYSAGRVVTVRPLYLVALCGAPFSVEAAVVPALSAALTSASGTVAGPVPVSVSDVVMEDDVSATDPPLPGGPVIHRQGGKFRFFCQLA